MYPIRIASVLESQISVLFTLRPAVFELQAIFRQMHWMTPKWPWTLQSHSYPICVSSVPESQISLLRQVHQMTPKWPGTLQGQMTTSYMCYYCPRFQISVSLYSQPFLNYKPFWKTNALNYPNWAWTLQGQMYPIYVLLVSMSPKFHSILLYDQPFLRYRQFWDKCTEWPQNDLEPYKVKGTSYMYLTTILKSQISSHFPLRPTVFMTQNCS